MKRKDFLKRSIAAGAGMGIGLTSLGKVLNEAEKALADARTSADRYTRAGEEALATAMRDAVLTMKSTLMAQFERDVQRMVSTVLADDRMFRQMVIELVGQVREETGIGDGAQ
ncbi:MAG: hypothetical protein AAF570_10525, partial [Bacteroidota bacterium]